MITFEPCGDPVIELSFWSESTQTMITMVLVRERFTKSRYTTHQPPVYGKSEMIGVGFEPTPPKRLVP